MSSAHRRAAALLCAGAALASTLFGSEDVYQKPSEFLSEVFDGKVPEAGAVVLTNQHQAEIKRLLGHAYPGGRVRYWSRGDRCAWILNEIGKTQPITTGYVVNGGKIERVKVLVYRESHGWEVRQKFFTDQFTGAQLDGRRNLTRRIDNIAGATLSTRALTKMAKLAVYLDTLRS